MDNRDLSAWVEWSDDALIDQAAAAAQCRILLSDEFVREAIALNIIKPFRQALAKARGNG